MDPGNRRRTSDGWWSTGRAVTVAVALAMVLSVTVGYAAADNTNQTQHAYAVEQGDECTEVTPLTGDDPAKAFYDYRTPLSDNPYTNTTGETYSSEGTADLQHPNASHLFLYEDSAGNLTLVFVHGALDNTSAGGAASFNVTDLPTEGNWTVKDDEYEGSNNYDNWTHDDGSARIDWTWDSGRTDGGAYTGLGEEFAVTIDPAFNESAALYGKGYEGTVERWELLSGNRTEPERTNLSLSEPAVVSTGGCDDGKTVTPDDDGTKTPDDSETEPSDGTETATPTTTERRVEQEQEVEVEQEQRPGTDDGNVEQEQEVEIRQGNETVTVTDDDGEADAVEGESDRGGDDGPPGANPGNGPPEDSPGNGPPDDVPRGPPDDVPRGAGPSGGGLPGNGLPGR